jgi:ribosome maturation factor RimP
VTTLPPRVQELAEQVAGGHGVDVLELALRRHGRSQVLSVVLDSDGPVDSDVIEQVTKELSHQLDEADPLQGSYTLEVTTPGLDRPLRSGRDFRRQRGHEVEILREARSDLAEAGGKADANPEARTDLAEASGEAGPSPAAGADPDPKAPTGPDPEAPAGPGPKARNDREARAGAAGNRRAASKDQGRAQIRGVVADADDQAVTLEVEGSQIRVPLSDVVRGRVVLPW